MRSRAKAVNFGIVYGQQAYGLSQSLGIGYQEAQEMIDRYFAAYPAVRSYLDSSVTQAHQQGWVETIFGRKRHIQELTSANPSLRGFSERTAMNHPLQGSAADIIKLAMIEVDRRIRAAGLISQMVLQVHDELDFNCAADELEQLSALVKQSMEQVVDLQVPLLAEISSGPNWAEAH
jgi:DNA polymerase-1